MNTGVCYFPEHWPASDMPDDVGSMAEAGLEYVRMGEFAWSRLEPEPGSFDFGWLEDAVDRIGEEGMRAVLCTPTATPPKWLVDEHPAILQEEPDGTTRHYGGRRHYCHNSDAYREESRRIVRTLAERFADDPTVVGWQTDNEYGCHDTIRCYCDDCAASFRAWLRDTYGDVETLKESWGTAFWSQDLNSFEQVDPPRHTAAGHHPSRLLDYYRFCSDSVVDYNREQVEILRDVEDDWFVTHNFMSHFGQLDAYDVSADLDFASWDSYPTGHVQGREDVSDEEFRIGDPDNIGLDHDLYRSATGSPFWVMEQQPGDINWPPYSPQPAEGAMRLWAHLAAAHGAETVSYFRWRQCRMGQEQYHSGLCRQDGSPDRGYHDAERAAGEFDRLADALDGEVDPGPGASLPDADVALLHEYDNLWALDVERNTPDFDYWAHLETYYTALRERGMQVDVLPPSADLADYPAVIAPTLYLVDDDLASRLESYVSAGGELLLTMRSGFKDPYNKLTDRPQPGPLTDLVGASVDEIESVPEQLESEVRYDGQVYDCRVWNEWLDPTGDARVGGRYEGELADGEPAIVRNELGDGSALYVGTWPDADLAGALVQDVLDRAGLETCDPLPDQVRFARRGGLTWVVNFRDDPLSVDAPPDATWFLGESTVGPFDASVTDAEPTDLRVIDAR